MQHMQVPLMSGGINKLVADPSMLPAQSTTIVIRFAVPWIVWHSDLLHTLAQASAENRTLCCPYPHILP